MLSTNEAKHVAVVDDWEDDPVAKAVDEPTVLAMVATPVMIIRRR
jgi:hypothetical protein